MSFGQAVATCFAKYFTFRGRASRSEFWWWALFVSILGVAGYVADDTLTAGKTAATGGLVTFLVMLAVWFPTVAVQVRRFHDMDRTGWLAGISFIPFGFLIMLAWFSLAGTYGPNRYGPDPLRPTRPAERRVETAE
jgi:uncharacterized membrane protein YhaH (DUF805 family)